MEEGILYDSALPIKCRCCPHVETSQLICCANQLTGFYMRATLSFNGLIVGKCLENEIIGLTPITRDTTILSKITRQSEIKPSKETKKKKKKKKNKHI